MYYDIVESGIRVKELRSVRNMTRQQLADEIGLSSVWMSTESRVSKPVIRNE